MKKGFTLIELLAVIVILAIIALIATPIVLSIIDDSKESSTKRSAEGYLRAVEYEIAQAYITPNRITEGVFNVLSGGNICIDGYSNNTCSGKVLEIEYNNEGPLSGTITLEEAKITHYTLTYPSGITVVDGRVGDQEEVFLTLGETIINKAKDNNYYYETVPDFSKPTKDGEYGLYQAPDDLGTSYYFRGDVDNNYIKFGTASFDTDVPIYKYRINVVVGYDENAYEDRYIGDTWYDSLEECKASSEYNEYKVYSLDACEALDLFGMETITKNISLLWRIVRINGDGSIRLIIDVNDDTYILLEEYYGFPAFNYAGMVDGKKINSEVKESVDKFYKDHLENKYDEYLVDTPYCAAYSTSGSLKCDGNTNKYTVDATKGNGLLDYPIGLITTKEVILAGGTYNGFEQEVGEASTSYLKYSGFARGLYGTMTKGNYIDEENTNEGLGYFGTSDGGYMDDFVYGNIGWTSDDTLMRPVINLKADVKVTGEGSYDNPYVIVTE